MKNRAKFEQLKAAAVSVYPDVLGDWLYERWRMWNEYAFEDELEPCMVTWGNLEAGVMGSYDPWLDTIVISRDLLWSKPTEPSERWPIDYKLAGYEIKEILLHEMIHQKLRFLEPTPHNNQAWVDEVNRIAPLLGLRANAAVINEDLPVDERENYMSLYALEQWPWSRHFGRMGSAKDDLEQEKVTVDYLSAWRVAVDAVRRVLAGGEPPAALEQAFSSLGGEQIDAGTLYTRARALLYQFCNDAGPGHDPHAVVFEWDDLREMELKNNG